jgi:hypothetical protein
VVFLLSACQQPVKIYEGPERPFAEVSRICCRAADIHGSLIGAKLLIEAIDGRDAGYFEMWAEIAPGRHEVRYVYLEGIGAYPIIVPVSVDRGRLVFNAQPGRGYILKAEREGNTTWAWIEDEASRALVAGQRPPT